MGCGKSSVGRELSTLLSCHFVDLDRVIEASEGRSIQEIFANDGEAAFRVIELDVLKKVIDEYSSSEAVLVLALGGGTVITPKCAKLVKLHTKCIYLRARVDTLLEHLSSERENRPMLQSEETLKERIISLLGLRSARYESTADFVTDIDGKSPKKIAQELIELISSL